MAQLASLAEAGDWRQPVLILNGDGTPAAPAWPTTPRAIAKPVEPAELTAVIVQQSGRVKLPGGA